jgi:voltage-gated potassium channel
VSPGEEVRMSQAWVEAPRRDLWARGLFVLGRVVLTVSALCATYFLIPTRAPGEGFGVPWLILQLGVFLAVVGAQVPAIIRSRYPILRAVESLAVLVPVYLLIFARIYLANSQNDPAGFSRSLDHVTALYFTVTVFATVGFGDIVALSDSMMLLVTTQMLGNLVVLGLGIRLLTSAARRGIARRGGQTDVGERDRPVV